MKQHFTAWLITAREALNSEYYEVEIVEDECSDVTGWERGSDVPVFEAETSIERETCDEKKAQEDAEEILRAASWYTVGSWTDVDTGYSVTVARR